MVGLVDFTKQNFNLKIHYNKVAIINYTLEKESSTYLGKGSYQWIDTWVV